MTENVLFHSVGILVLTPFSKLTLFSRLLKISGRYAQLGNYNVLLYICIFLVRGNATIPIPMIMLGVTAMEK